MNNTKERSVGSLGSGTRPVSHTSGPWNVCGGFTVPYTSISSDNGYIVWIFAHNEIKENGKTIKCPSPDEQRANARLIAASPDLFEACLFGQMMGHSANVLLHNAGKILIEMGKKDGLEHIVSMGEQLLKKAELEFNAVSKAQKGIHAHS